MRRAPRHSSSGEERASCHGISRQLPEKGGRSGIYRDLPVPGYGSLFQDPEDPSHLLPLLKPFLQKQGFRLVSRFQGPQDHHRALCHKQTPAGFIIVFQLIFRKLRVDHKLRH